MTACALIVEVADTARDTRREYVFARSPVRVGRSQLNDLPLEHAFVSHCHGLFHFDATRVEFVDVGSTNGTFLAGRRLDKNQRVALSASRALVIGALCLHVRLEPRSINDTRASYAFRALGSQRTSPPPARSALAAAESRSEVSPSSSAPDELRIGQLNERFAQSFLELRRGQHQLLRDLGFSVPSTDGLQTIDSTRELLAYLLDPSAVTDRLDELSRAHADLMMHEVALVSAVSAGSRELLDELSPTNLAPQGMGGVVGWIARLVGHDTRWKLFERKTEELREEAALAAVVFGRGFARAYAAALGKTLQADRTPRPPESTGS